MEKIGISHGARVWPVHVYACVRPVAAAAKFHPPPFLPPQLVVPKLPSSYHKLSYEVGFDIVITKCQKKFA